MNPYHKIQTVFKRDPVTRYKTFLDEYTLPEFEYLRNNNWIFTEKVDGTNIRVMSLPDGKVEFSGRTDNAQIPAKLITRLQELFPPNGKLHKQFPDGACLYGEGYGAGIQKGGGNYSVTQEFVLFDVKIGHYWLERDNVLEIADMLEIHWVPLVENGSLADAVRFVRDGFKSVWGDFQAEGIVLRPEVELFDRNEKRIIAKLKCKDYA